MPGDSPGFPGISPCPVLKTCVRFVLGHISDFFQIKKFTLTSISNTDVDACVLYFTHYWLKLYPLQIIMVLTTFGFFSWKFVIGFRDVRPNDENQMPLHSLRFKPGRRKKKHSAHRRTPPPPGQICASSCSFWQKSCKTVDFYPKVGGCAPIWKILDPPIPSWVQDFPEGMSAPTPKMNVLTNFFAENCMKIKEFGPPLDPPMPLT